MECYILQNPKEVHDMLISAQITSSDNSVGHGLIVSYNLSGIRRTQDGVSKSLRGAKMIFTREWGKGAIWKKESLTK